MNIFFSLAFSCVTLQTVFGNCPPIRPKKGMEIRCLTPDRNSFLNCAEGDLPQGVELQYRCRNLFRNFDGIQQQNGQMTCSPQNRWINSAAFLEFQCLPECGRPANATLDTVSSFIEREFETGEEIFPWHGAIFKRFGATESFRYQCGATLVNPENKGYFVLTAAHCVTKNPLTTEPGPQDSFRIVLGAVSTDFEGNVAGSSQIFSPKKIVIEKEYDPHSLQSNIAMIELNGPVKISETVLPVCFPTRTIANVQVRPGVIGEIPVIRSDQLAYQEILKLPVSEQGQCLRDCAREPTITEFCAIHATRTRLTPLESGTGLVFSDVGGSARQIFFLQGILTKVVGEAEGCTAHDTFTSVSVFLDWMNKVHDELAESQRVTEVTVPYPHPQPHTPPTRIPSTNSIEERPQFPHHNQAPIPTMDILNLGQNIHNYYRRLHEAPPVRINTKLSKEAQDWADYLLHENKWEFSQGKDYSENIFQYFGKISDSEVIRKAVDNWYNAKSKYNWNFPEASTFSQVIWKDTTEIGIGIASKGTKSVVVANYWPRGNVYNTGNGQDRSKYFRENVLPRPSLPDSVSLI